MSSRLAQACKARLARIFDSNTYGRPRRRKVKRQAHRLAQAQRTAVAELLEDRCLLTVLDFEGQGSHIPDGYGGFNWSSSDSYYYNNSSFPAPDLLASSGYGAVSGNDAAWNGWAGKNSYVTLQGSGTFNFDGAYFREGNGAYVLRLDGYNNGVLQGSEVVDVTTTWQFFSSNLNNIDQLVIRVTSGAYSGQGVSNTGWWAMDDFTINSNDVPTAVANGPYSVAEGGSVTLSASGSFDPDGSIAAYEWDLDNNGTFETTGSSPVFSAIGLDGPDTRTVRLRVRDNSGAYSAVDTATVTINNVAPELSSGAVDLNAWSQEDLTSGAGNWTVSGGGETVFQSINGNPTVFRSDFNIFGEDIQGKIQVQETGGDDDFIGFVLGFSPGDFSNSSADYLLVDWKQGDQNPGSPYGFGAAGLAVSRISGVPSIGDFWSHSNGVNELQRGITLGSTGWVDNAINEFTFEYDANQLKVFVNGTLELNVAAPSGNPFPNGRIGFYNFSQSSVQYSTFSIDSVVGVEGTPVTVSKDFTDVGLADTHTATIDWGDGTVTAGTVTGTPGGSGTVTGSHTYADNGEYTVTITVTDDDGGSDSDTLTATIANADPVLTSLDLSDTSITEGGDVIVSGSFTDPGTADTHDVVIDWGDGTTSVAVVTQGSGSGTFTATRPYLDDGPSPGNGTASDNYTITATVTDDDGASDTASATLTVNNVAPSLENIAITSPVNEGSAATLTADIVDPGTLDEFTLVVDWGDGSPQQTVTVPAGSTSFSVDHVYIDDNPTLTPSDNYEVTIVSFSDDDGGSAGVSQGGSIFLTGHDILSHGNQQGYSNVALNYLRGAGSLSEIPVSDYDIGVIAINVDNTNSTINQGGGVVINPSQLWDPRNGVPYPMNTLTIGAGTTAAQFEQFLNGIDVLVIPEHGLANNIAKFNSFAPEIEEFFNAGGDLFVDSSNALANYYDFLPSAIGADGPGISSSSGFQVTSAGAAIGIQPTMLNFATHNTFANPNSVFTIFEIYQQTGNPVTIGAQNVVISNGTLGSAFQVTVNNVAPVAGGLTLSSPSINENGTVSVSGSFTDVGTEDTHEVVIDWGDGTTSEPIVIQGSGSGTFEATHQYLDDGPNPGNGISSHNYTITATVTDDDGGSDAASATVTVNNVAPEVDPLTLSDTTINEDGTVTVSGSFTDVGTEDTHEVVIDWGDGTSSAATVTQGSGSGTFTATHQYLDDGPYPGNGTASDNYTITATVTDDDGGSDSASATVTVNNVAPSGLTLSLAATSINEGQSASLSGSFADPGTKDVHTVTIDWGDGSAAQTLTLGAGVTSFSNITHVYPDDGPSPGNGTPSDTYTINVSVEDDDGGALGSGQQALRPNVMRSGSSSRDISTFFPSGTSFNVVAGNAPDANTQALFVTRSGLSGLNATTLQAYLNDGGIIITEWSNTDDVFNLVFNENVSQGTWQGNCWDRVNPVIQLNTQEPIWQALNPLAPPPSNQAGCGYDISAFPGITPIGAWANGAVQLAYRDLGAGRLWLVEADWQDTNTTGAAYAESEAILGYMMTNGASAAPPTIDITVHNVAPVAGGLTLSSSSIDENGSVTVTGSFTDVGTQDAHTVTINWGDGTTSSATVTQGSGSGTFTATHQYLDDGPSPGNGTAADNYTITATVTDDDGASDSASSSVTVSNVAPSLGTVQITSSIIDEDDSVTISGSFTDAGTLDTHAIEVNWGDGTTTAAIVDASSRTYTATHQYLDDDPSGTISDTYRIDVAIVDDDGGTDAAVSRVIVRNVAPAATMMLNTSSIDENGSVTVTGSFTDVGTQDTHTVVIAWGDGTTSPAVVTQGSGSGTFTATHQYPDDNPTATPADNYTITATVTDDDGGSHSAAATLTVNNVAPELSSGAVDLNAWAQEDLTPGAGNWSVSGGGETVFQSINGNPTVFRSDFNIFGEDIQGKIQVQTTGDDDFVGFVLGFAPGDFSNSSADYLLVDWKQGDQNAGAPYGFGTAGLAVSRVSGVPSLGDFWSHSNGVSELQRAATLGSTGWVDNAVNEFTFEYDAGQLKVFVNGTLELNVAAPSGNPFPDGRIGFYNYSQGSVQYSTFSIDSVVGVEGTPVSVSKKFTDVGLADTHTATIDWGDGTVTAGTVTGTPGGSGTVTGNHVYADNGEYTVTITVTDDDGGSDSDSLTATIANANPDLPAINLSSSSIDESGTVTVTGSFTDPGTADTHTVEINWGDGTSSAATVTQGSGSGTFTANHQYLDDGPSPGNGTASDNYTITATVTDDDGGSDSASATVTVNNVDPSLQNVTLTPVIDENGVATLAGDIVDPGTLDEFTLTVDWGDGSAPETFTYAAGTTSFSETHQYLDDNPTATASDTYNVSIVSFTDDDGGAAAATGAGGGKLYGLSTSTDSLYSLDTATGAATLVTALSNGNVSLTGLAFLDGVLYASDIFGSGGRIGTIDLNTGAYTPVGNQDGSSNWHGLAANQSGNLLYSIDINDNNRLKSMTPSGVVTTIGPATSVDGRGMAYDDANGILYATDTGGLLYTVDTSTGATSLVGSMGIDTGIVGLAYDESTTTLYANDASASRLYSVDVTTGATTLVGSNGVSFIDGLAWGGDAGAGLSITVNNVAPVAGGLTLSSSSIDEDGTVTVTGSFTDVGTQDTHTVTINWGDGTSSAATVTQGSGSGTFTAIHQYLDDGPSPGNGTAADNYTITATVTDDDGGSDSASATVTVNNVAPTLVLDPVVAIDENGVATLTGTITDPGTLDTFTLDINWGDPLSPDNTETYTFGASATGSQTFTLTHQYLDDNPTSTSSDTYTISATVTDDDTGTGSDTQTVVVNNVAPTLVLDPVVAIDENGVATLTGTITDPGTLDTFTLDINWGDPLSPNDTETYTFGASATGSQTFTLTHQYLDDNPTSTGSDTYTISATVTDDDTGSGSDTQTVVVNNVAPTLVLDPVVAIDENGVATLTGTITDPGTLDTFTLDINWGDPLSPNDTETYTFGASATGSQTFTLTHQYLDDNPTSTSSDTYTISATVTDDDTGTGSDTETVVVNNVAPTLVLDPVVAIDENGVATLTGTITDPGTLDTFTLDINWGDPLSPNDTETYTFGASATGSQTFTLTHQYLDDNPTATSSDTYTISATVTDDDTGSGSDTQTVVVNNVAPALVLDPVVAIDENGVATLTGTITDPGTLDTFTLDINWGDPLSPNDTETYTFGASSTGSQTFTLTHQYLDDNPTATSSDTYTISATVTDDDTGTGSDTETVVVNNVAPTLALDPVVAIDENGVATLTGTITDPGTLDTFTLDINWGDPLSPNDTETYTFGASASGSQTFTLTHQYLDDNPSSTGSDSYTISATVTDDDTGSGSDTETVVVNNVAPTLVLDPVVAIDENGVATLTGTITDPGTLDTFTLDINWGDPLSPNDTETYTFGASSTGSQTFTLTHQYLDDNPSSTSSDTYTISATVTDDDTGTGSDTETVVVNNVAPVSGGVTTDATMPCDASEDLTVQLNGSFSDIGSLDTHTVFVDWGDGTSEFISVDQLADTYAAAHDYAHGGNYEVTVTVTDDDGGSVGDTTSAVVEGVGVVNGTLYIIGTDNRDHVKLKVNEKKDQLKVDVKLNQKGSDGGSDGSDGGSDRGSDRGSDGGSDNKADRYKLTLTASAIDRVVAFLCDGDDHYDGGSDGSDGGSDGSDGGSDGSDGGSDGGNDAGSNINIRQLVFGGAGNDHLDGGRWDDAIFGGEGRDKIKGRSGNDILAGGDGKDDIKGGRGNDVLIGGIVDNDFNDVSIVAEVDAALTEWASGDLADALDLLGPIIDDGDRDKLFGEKDDDELFGGSGDRTKQ